MLGVSEFIYSLQNLVLARYAMFRYFILSVNLRMHVCVQRGWQCLRFWVSYTRVWGMWELTFRFWGGSLWSSRFLRSPPLFFLLHVAALKKTLAVSTDVEIILEESVCVGGRASFVKRGIQVHMRACRSLPLPQSTLGRPWVWPARKWNPCASQARNSPAKLQERGTAYVSSRKTNSPHSTSDNAFQLLFSFSNLFWIICLPLQKYFWVVKTEVYWLETYTGCCLSSAQAHAHPCTLDWGGVLCVYRTALPLIGRIDHFHMAVGCTSATDVSLPPCIFVLLLISPCSLERCMVGNRMSPTRWHVSTLHFLFSQSLCLCFCLIIDSLNLSFNGLFNADSHCD